MNLPELSIKRPVFVTCVVVLILVLGVMGYNSLGVDLFPDVTFPYVMVNTPYPGAAPQEVEIQVSKPLEEEISSLEGVKKVSSTNLEGYSVVSVQFTLETDSKVAEQRVRDRVAYIRAKLPKDIEEPVIRRWDPSDAPVIQLALQSDLSPAAAYDLADQVVKPAFSQVGGVGVVEVTGGTKREIRVVLDRKKLNAAEISAGQVAQKIGLNGLNVPLGKHEEGGKNLLFRSVGQYDDLDRLRSTVVSFLGSDVPKTVGDLGAVEDGLEERQTANFVNGKEALFINIYKQTRANTVAVVDEAMRREAALNEDLKARSGGPQLVLVHDDARPVRMNLADVRQTILLGILLTVLVVTAFLGSFRSTIITITSLPVSLLGAFILMQAMGFTVNVMTLLALSLAVGLLIDDAIVVRENIWRHIEEGADSKTAALEGTLEVALAVVATTSVVISVFLPIAFLKGTVGQFFKQFGFTVCFAMAVSLFEAMTMGPMLSAYWAGKRRSAQGHVSGRGLFGLVDRFQKSLEELYVRTIDWTLVGWRRWLSVPLFLAVMLTSGVLLSHVDKTFMPSSDVGEFVVFLKGAPGTSLDAMEKRAMAMEQVIRMHPEVAFTSGEVGNNQGEYHKSKLYVKLTPYRERKLTTSDLKDKVREDLKPFRDELQPQVADASHFGDWAPFNLNLVGDDYNVLIAQTDEIVKRFRTIKGLADVQTNFDGGKPEFQAKLDPNRMRDLGVLGIDAGMELRTQVEGTVAAKFRDNGQEYDIRVRLEDDQRNLEKEFPRVWVPNQNHNLVRLADISTPLKTEGPSTINRQNRARYIQVSGQIGPGGALGNIQADAEKIMKGMTLPPGVHYEFVGQSEDMKDLITSMVTAVGLAILFTFMILASLYESPIIPFAILPAIPMSVVGAFFALMITHKTLDIFSMIAIVMLFGLVTKNSILLVDYILLGIGKGLPRNEAIREAGRIRLRPILMTTLALVAGMMPLALALSEVGKFRQSMGVAVVGGLISSFFLTLLIVPAVYSIVDDVRLYSRILFGTDPSPYGSRWPRWVHGWFQGRKARQEPKSILDKYLESR